MTSYEIVEKFIEDHALDAGYGAEYDAAVAALEEMRRKERAFDQMMESPIVLRALRSMAWERAKGELRSMLQTYNSSEGASSKEQFDHVDSLISAFIMTVENHGLQE